MTEVQSYVYISTRASVDPVKTVMLFAPSERARTVAEAEAFARASGWVEAVERDAAVLVAPAAPEGWESCPSSLALDLYQEKRRSFKAAGEGIAGRGGALWAWETLIYLVGYEDGAAFAGRAQVAYPGLAAATALIGGAPRDLTALEEPSCHWLVPQPRDYALRNGDIPISLWAMGVAESEPLVRHAIAVGTATAARIEERGGHMTRMYENPENVGIQVRVTPGITGANPAGTDPLSADPALAQLVMDDFFCRIIRWKNAPDGTLAPRRTKAAFYADGTYRHGEVVHGEGRYHYAIYLPEGMGAADAAGLPLVISLHGRGEPTWLFSEKNGWERLADETGAFAVLLPDSPGNIWALERDEGALLAMIDEVTDAYGLDPERVYLTGFSNGACFTCQMATTHPERFAAAAPWNGPVPEAIVSSGMGAYVWRPGFDDAGWELPFWMCFGDADDKAPADRMDEFAHVLAANGCGAEPVAVWTGANRYTADAGYREGDRLETRVFADAAGVEKSCYTVVKNMPHGAIADEARACWEFMRRFRRVAGAKRVEVI